MWSKAGLMARESIDPSDGGSRMAAVVTTPAADQLGLDGSYGANTLSFQVRDKTDAGAYEPGVNGAAGLYIGDFVLAPSYPNQWLRLTRQTDGVNDLFTAYASTNNADWTWLGEFNPVDTGASNAFPSVVNVGLCASTDIYPPNDWLVTAMYQNFGNYVKVVEGPTLTVTFVAASSSLTISWTPAGGSLYSSPVLGSGAVWTLVTANNPATIPITKSEPTMFFKVISP
jgi:hypothetical protein